jgi:hypothetical protein
MTRRGSCASLEAGVYTPISKKNETEGASFRWIRRNLTSIYLKEDRKKKIQ